MKKIVLGLAAAAGIAAMSMSAFAGVWKSDATGWWYDYGNGTWPASSWQWIDGNNDGVAECYYFDQYGYCLMNTSTPDGYNVDGSGAWVLNGAVQTRNVGTSNQSTAQSSTSSSSSASSSSSNAAALDLLTVDPSTGWGFYKEENARTMQSALWSKTYQMNSYESSYAEFYNGGQYNTLTFEFAAKKGANSKMKYTLEVYGDDDTLLEQIDNCTYKTHKTVTVDISGQEYVKICLDDVDGGYYDYILFKNMYFK